MLKFKRGMNATGAGGLAVLALANLALAQAPVSTQGAVDAALGAPAQAKVAAPATPPTPTVTPGRGGGPSSAPDPLTACIPNCTPEQRAAREAQVAATPMGRLMTYVQGAKWPTGPTAPVASGINHSLIELVTRDGRNLSLERTYPTGVMTGSVTGYNFLPGEPSPGNVVTRVLADGNNLNVYLGVSLTTGEMITPPPISIPNTGGTRTVALEGGGSLTVTVDGAHAATAAEQAAADQAIRMTRGGAP